MNRFIFTYLNEQSRYTYKSVFLKIFLGEGTQLRLLDTTYDILKFSCRIFVNLHLIVNQYELNGLVHLYLQLRSYYFIFML